MPLGPAEIHAHEHLRPIGCVGPADAGADREHRVALVVRARELRLEARLLDLIPEHGELAVDIGRKRRVVEGEELCEIVGAFGEPVPALDAWAQEAEPLQYLLRALSVVPEIRTRRLCFELC